MSYPNGQIPTSQLVPAANGTPAQLLERQTAAQWAWMVADAAAAGVHLAPEPDNGVPSCYRDLAGQRNAWAIYQRDGYPTAAVVGTSNHGEGTAIDIDLNPVVTEWLDQHADTYGFAFDVKGEPWHAHRVRTIQVPTTKGTTDMIIGIKGKAGARRGGSYYVNGGVAHFIGAGIPAGVPTYTDEGEIAALQHVISGLA